VTLVTTIADPEANSYISLADAETYLENRVGFDLTAWNALSDEQKEWNLTLAVPILDSLRFRGVKATNAQVLAFPRILPRTDWWDATKAAYENSYDTWEDMQTDATENSYTMPSIPDGVKHAQVEIAFQVIQNHYNTLDPMQEGSAQTNFVGIGKLQVQFGQKAGEVTKEFLDKSAFGATSIVKFYLKPYLASGMTAYGF